MRNEEVDSLPPPSEEPQDPGWDSLSCRTRGHRQLSSGPHSVLPCGGQRSESIGIPWPKLIPPLPRNGSPGLLWETSYKEQGDGVRFCKNEQVSWKG